MLDIQRVKDLPPNWWAAIAGAAAAGAVLLPDSRLIAGAVAGGAMTWLALRMTSKPCCADCAEGAKTQAFVKEPAGDGNAYLPNDGPTGADSSAATLAAVRSCV